MTNFTYDNFIDTPKVNFDQVNGQILISGRSININPNLFWNSLTHQLKEFVKKSKSKSKTSIRFEMEYINASSIKELRELIFLIKTWKGKGENLEIEWLYQKGDDDMLDLGYFIHEVFEYPMTYIELN